MTRRKLSLIGLIVVSLAVPTVLTSRAQERRPDRQDAPAQAAVVPIQDALNKPFAFPFAEETALKDVVEHLAKALQVRVVLDRAALDRLQIEEDDTVRLKLEGVRLKVGLRLLLDQLEMTYRVEPDDNLLILTDSAGSEDPIDKIVTEIKAVHRDVHDLQDAVDEIRSAMDLGGEAGPRMHKPTIIEELPSKPDSKTTEKDKDEPVPGPANPPRPRRSGV
jgi:hypothetical protein